MVDLPAVICQRVPGDLDVDQKIRASLVAQMVKTQPAMQEAWVKSLGPKDPLKKGMATHSSTLA